MQHDAAIYSLARNKRNNIFLIYNATLLSHKLIENIARVTGQVNSKYLAAF